MENPEIRKVKNHAFEQAAYLYFENVISPEQWDKLIDQIAAANTEEEISSLLHEYQPNGV